MTLPKVLSLVFFLALPLAAQTELPITAPTRDPAVGNQYAPRAASLGDRGLIVWSEGAAGFGGPSISSSIRAARVDGDGKLLDQNALIIDSVPDYVQTSYDVAATGDGFAVAYSDFELKVRSVGRDGALGDPGMLGPFVGSALRIAASNDGSRVIVVWSQPTLPSGDQPAYIYTAALLDHDLHLLATNIGIGTLATPSPAFAVVPRGDGFAVIALSSDAIVAWTLDANAQRTGERSLASVTTGVFTNSSIDAAATGDQVSIITAGSELRWASTDVVSTVALSGGLPVAIGDSVVVATIESSGIALHDQSSPSLPTTVIEVRPPHSVQAAAVIRLTSGIYTAFMTDDGLGQTDLFGALNSGPIDIIAGSPSFQTAPAIASDAAGESLVVWREFSTRARVWHVLARMIDRAGTPVGNVATVSSENIAFGTPRVTSDGNRFLVTYGVGEIRGQFVSSGGALMGDPFIITQSGFAFLNYSGWNDATWNGQRYLVTWVEGAAGRFVTDAHAVGAFVGDDGSVGPPFRITSGQAASYSQASSPAGDTLLTTFDVNGFASYVVHADGSIGGPYFTVAPGASIPVVAWSGSAFLAAWRGKDGLQSAVIHADGSTTVLPSTGFTMSPTHAIGNLVTGVTSDGVVEVQLDPAGHPMGGPLLVARGAASPTVSEAGVIAYTRADDRDITRIFVQRPASATRHRAAAR